MEKIKAFDIFYPVENEFEIIQSLVLIYLQNEVTTGRLNSMPSPKMVSALVFYVKYGYTPEAKEKTMRYLKLPHMQAVDGINHKLKTVGLLVDSAMSKKNKRLNDSLEKFREYIRLNIGGTFVIRSIIYQNGKN